MKVISIHNFISNSGSGTVINYGSDADFLTSYVSSSDSGSNSQKVTVPTVPVPQHCIWITTRKVKKERIRNLTLRIKPN
jgi:hypothetical protein